MEASDIKRDLFWVQKKVLLPSSYTLLSFFFNGSPQGCYLPVVIVPTVTETISFLLKLH